MGLHEQGTFWSLEKRDPGDLKGLEKEYHELLRRFRPLLPPTWFENESLPGGGEREGGGEGRTKAGENGKGSRGVASLGRRITERALELDAAAHAGVFASPRGKGGGRNGARSSPAENGGKGKNGGKEACFERGRTLVHGDLKSWNAFFVREDGGKKGGSGEGGAAAAAISGGERVKFIDWQVGRIRGKRGAGVQAV